MKFLHDRAAMIKIDTSKTVCHGDSAGAITCYASLFFNTTRIKHPNITNALVPDPDLDQYKINVAAACAGGFDTSMNVTQDSIDLAPGAAVWDLHGTEDDVVPLEMSDKLMEVAAEFGVPHDQVVIEGGGHGITQYLRGDVLEEMFDFIFEHLGVTERSSDALDSRITMSSLSSSSLAPVFALGLVLLQLSMVAAL